MWYHKVIGAERCPIVDTWWQTETGAIMMSPIPGVTPTKPGSCAKPLPGIFADIVDDEGRSVKNARRRRLPRDQAALALDAADDLGGQRALSQDLLGEIPGSLLRCRGLGAPRQGWLLLDHGPYRRRTERRRPPARNHGNRIGAGGSSARCRGRRGRASLTTSRANRYSPTWCSISRGPKQATAQSLIEELRVWVGEQLSPIAKPDEIRLTDNLPKTRSGKIMRRLLRSIARGEEITQDMSTLENPGILEQLRGGAAPTPALKKKAGVRTRVKAAKPAKVAAKRGKRASTSQASQAQSCGGKIAPRRRQTGASQAAPQEIIQSGMFILSSNACEA